MLKTIAYLFYLELALLLRRSSAWLYPMVFFMLVMCLFPLAFTPDPFFLQKIVPGCIWIAALLSSFLSIEHIFFSETEDGSLDQLLLSPLPLIVILYVKLSAQWLVTELPLIVLSPLFSWMFHLPLSGMLPLCLSLLFGTPILTLIGSLGTALTLGLRQQGMLLGLLIFPLVTPVLIFGVNVVEQHQAGLSIEGPLAFLCGLCVFAMTLVPWAIEFSLRTSADQ